MPGYCDACPAKHECDFAHRCFLFSALRRRTKVDESSCSIFSFMRARASPASHANRVFHGVGVRTAVPDHARRRGRLAAERPVFRINQSSFEAALKAPFESIPPTCETS